MEDYKRGSHTVWDCKYHIVWTTKYRYQVLGVEIGLRCRELPREIARSKEMAIYAASINRDHVHLLIGIPPQLSVSRSVQYLKGKSSHKLLSEYTKLRKQRNYVLLRTAANRAIHRVGTTSATTSYCPAMSTVTCATIILN